MNKYPIGFKLYQTVATTRSNLQDGLMRVFTVGQYSEINVGFLNRFNHNFLQDALKREYGE